VAAVSYVDPRAEFDFADSPETVGDVYREAARVLGT
jgi:hypothetical protein